MNESTFWKRRVRTLLSTACLEVGARHHFERVENRVAEGTPDVDYCVSGVCGKIELKYVDRVPARPTTRILPLGRGVRRSQGVWAAARINAGGRVHILVGVPGCAWLFVARTHDQLRWLLDRINAGGVYAYDEACSWRSGKSNALLVNVLTER